MPYKKGPNNTIRYYDSSTGKYASSFSNIQFAKEKMSKEEKEMLKKESLFNHASKTKDKYVYDLFLELEKTKPGCVIIVNEKVYHKKIKQPREIDLMTKDYIIEVKSGKVKHRSTQFLSQQDLSNDLGKKHIVYAPDISDKKYNELREKGIDVVRTKKDLMERVI